MVDLQSTVLACLYVFFKNRQGTGSTIDDATIAEKLSSNGCDTNLDQIRLCIEELRSKEYVITHDGSTLQRPGRIIVSSVTPSGNIAAENIIEEREAFM